MKITPEEINAARRALARHQWRRANLAARRFIESLKAPSPAPIPDPAPDQPAGKVRCLGSGGLSPFERIQFQERGTFFD